MLSVSENTVLSDRQLQNYLGVGEIGLISIGQKEILEMLAKGLLYKEIADQMSLSAETVKKHVYHIYEKLHVSNRVEAVNRFFGR